MRPKIGLALSSGTLRGAFTAGILKVLKSEGIPIDMVAGSSAGAAAALAVGKGLDPGFIEEWLSKIRPYHYIFPELHDDLGVLNCGKLIERIERVVGDIQFSDLEIPTALIALDLETSELISFTKGKVLEALRASIAMPGLFPPLRKNGHYYVDAGIVNPLPIDVVRKMGADIVIAVDHGPLMQGKMKFLEKRHRRIVGRLRRVRSAWVLLNRWGRLLHLEAINRAISEYHPEIVFSLHKELVKRGINKDIGGLFDTRKLKTLIKIGEEAARDTLPEIKKIIKKI